MPFIHIHNIPTHTKQAQIREGQHLAHVTLASFTTHQHVQSKLHSQHQHEFTPGSLTTSPTRTTQSQIRGGQHQVHTPDFKLMHGSHRRIRPASRTAVDRSERPTHASKLLDPQPIPLPTRQPGCDSSFKRGAHGSWAHRHIATVTDRVRVIFATGTRSVHVIGNSV